MHNGWKTTAMYRLGHHWQDAGDYRRAEAAYARVLRCDPKNHAALYNRAMALVRLGRHLEAETALAELWVDLGVSVANREVHVERRRRGDAYAVVYSTALVKHYLGELDAARELTTALSRTLLLLDAPDAMECSALMLHASVIVVRTAERLGDDAAADPLVSHAIDVAAGHGPSSPERAWLAEHLDAPGEIERYVVDVAGDDPRANYNIACYLARLVPLAEGEDRERLQERMRARSRIAFNDAALVPWAAQDPALESLREDPAGQALLDRAVEKTAPALDQETLATSAHA